MGDREVTKTEVERLIEDASYLQNEAEALKYVIEDVPYETEFPDSRSIADLLKLMDHAQTSYYRPVIREIINSQRPIYLSDFEHYKDTFAPESDENDIQRILDALATHRASLVNDLNNISLIVWEKACYDDDKEILLADIVKRMNRDDQIHLKKITSLVKSYHEEKKTQREIKQRQKRQNFGREEGT